MNSASTEISAQHRAIIDPLLKAALLTMHEMAGLEVSPGAPAYRCTKHMTGDISAVIGLISTTQGSIVLTMSERTAVALAKRILPASDEELSVELIRDCVGEIANVIAGQTKGLLSKTEHRFAISTPTIICGTSHAVTHRNTAQCLMMTFNSDVGVFSLQLCLDQ